MLQSTSPQVAAASSSDANGGTCWLDHRHPEWKANIRRWAFTRDQYTAEVLDEGKVADYLVQRLQGESDETFRERCRLADFTNHFATAVDSLVGMLGNVEGDANRVYQDKKNDQLTWGDRIDPASFIGRMWQDADGQGTSWENFWKAINTELSLHHLTWIVADNHCDRAVIRNVVAESCVNWWYGPRTLSQDPEERKAAPWGLVKALVMETVDTRSDITDDADKASSTRYVLYTLAGWERWEKNAKGEAVRVDGDAGAGEYAYEDRDGNPMLPIFPVRIPMRRNVGWYLAKKNNVIFNKESERDHILRVANFPKLLLVGTEEQAKKKAADLKKGANVLHRIPGQDADAYIAPDASCATVAGEALEKKVKDFHRTAFNEYDQGVVPRTATEVRQVVSSGAGAWLQQLKTTLDGAENAAYPLLAQVEFPKKRDLWWIARCERSDNFLPADPDTVVDKQAARTFGTGKAVPLGRTARIAVAKQVAEHQGAAVNEVQIAAAVDAQAMLDAIAQNPNLPIPPALEARIVAKLAAAHEFVDPEEEVTDAEGNKVKLLKQIEQQAEQMSAQKAEAARRMAEGFGGGGAGTGGGTTPSTPPDDDPTE